MLSTLLSGPVLALINGPVFSIIDKLIPDRDLRLRLKSEITSKTLAHQDKIAEAQKQILLEELSGGSLLTRSWRPLLMYVIILFLLLYGLVLPVADLVTGHPVLFKPRWGDIPDGLWNLLGLGVGGYIGGRSLEKIAGSLQKTPKKTISAPHST